MNSRRAGNPTSFPGFPISRRSCFMATGAWACSPSTKCCPAALLTLRPCRRIGPGHRTRRLSCTCPVLTGAPKGVQQSHDALLRNAYSTAHHRAYIDGWRVLFALPLYHAFALVKGVLSPLWVGGAIIPQLTFDLVDTFRGIERHRATDALFVPTMVMALIEHPDSSSMIAGTIRCRADPRLRVAATDRPVRTCRGRHRLWHDRTRRSDDDD